MADEGHSYTIYYPFEKVCGQRKMHLYTERITDLIRVLSLLDSVASMPFDDTPLAKSDALPASSAKLYEHLQKALSGSFADLDI